MRTYDSLPSLRALTLSVTLLLATLAAASSSLAGAEPSPPTSGSISIKTYLPELKRLRQAGDWTGLERVSRQALSILSDRNGPGSVDAAASSFWLASAFKGQGRYAEAEPLYQLSLGILEKTLGSDNLNVAAALDDLGNLYEAQGQYAKAEPVLQRALGIREKVLGPNHLDVAQSLNSLALLYWEEGQYEKPEPLYQRALGIREKALGPNHPDVAINLDNLAMLYAAQGQYAKAEPLCQRALGIEEKSLGPGHLDVAITLNNLASLYEKLGEYAKAEPLYQRALDINEKALGSDHPNVAKSLNNLADLHYEQGQFARAEPLYQRALVIEEKSLGPDHPLVAATLNNLARLYQTQDQYAKAEPLHQRALGIREKAFGPNHQDVATSLSNLAYLYQAQGQYAKAEPLYQRALAIDEKSLGPDHPTVAYGLNNLGEIYRAQGLYTRAEPLYQRALAIREKAFGPEHPLMAAPLHNLALLYDAQGQYAKGEPLHQRALHIREKAFGPEHPNTATARESLAESEASQGRFDQATANYRLACSARASVIHSANQSGEMTQTVQTSAGECSQHYALSLWGWSAQGGGTAAADRPDALKREAFTASQQAVQSAAGTAMARSAALTAAYSAGVGPEARDYEAALLERERLDEAYAKAAGSTGQRSTESLHALAKARDEVVLRIIRLEAALKSKAPLYWDYRAPTPVSVTALQAAEGPDSSLLHENEVLIFFLVASGKERGLAFAVSKQRAAWARIGMTGSELQAAVVRLRSEIDPEGYALHDSQGMVSTGVPVTAAPFDRQLAYRLHQVLLGESSIQQVIQDKVVLLFVPSGALTALPPGLLISVEPSGRAGEDIDATALRATAWLLRSKAVALLPAVSSLRTLRQMLPTGHIGTSDPLLAFADPLFTPPDRGSPGQRAARPRAFKTYFRDGVPLAEAMESLPALPGTRIEAEALRRALGAPPSSLLLGRNASKAQLMARNSDGRLAQVRVLEFATHGLVAGDVSDVAEPGLVLAAGAKPEDALLLASEASTLRLNADWVLLSACNTASPDAPEAEGLSGLSRAFFYAGARSLLVSHWLVRDEVAPILIPAVLQAERDNPHLTRAEALRRASLAILDDPHFDAASPAAWAAFTLVGEAGRD